MAERIFQPSMSSVAPRPFVQEGVVDRSGGARVAASSASESGAIQASGISTAAGIQREAADTKLLGSAIKDVGGMAVDAMKGYELAKLEKEQEAVISEYMQRRGGADPQDLIDASTLDSARASLFMEGASDEEVAPVTAKFKEKLGKYQKAMEAGAMSAEEFTTRMLTTTREAVNRSPGLYPELLQHAQKVQEMSGVGQIVKMDQQIKEQQAKSIADSQKNLRELSDKLNVSYDYANPNYTDMQAQVHQRQREIAASDALTRASTAKQAFTKEQALAWIGSDGVNAINGDMYKLTSNFSQMFRGASPKDFAQLKYQMQQEIVGAKNRLFTAVSKTGIVNDPNVQELIKRHTDSLDTLFKSVETLQSGEDAAKAMENSYKRLEVEQKFNFAKKYDVPSINALRLIPDAVMQKWSLNNKDNLEGIMTLTDSLVNATTHNPQLGKSLTETKLQKGVPDAVTVSFGMFDGGDTPSFEKAVTTLRTSIIDSPKFKNESEKLVAMEGFVRELGKTERKGKFVNVTPTAVGDSYKIVDEYITTTSKFMSQEAANIGGVKAEVMPDGRLLFSGNNASGVAKMNRDFASRINEGIVAMANVMNVSTKEAAKLSYPRYKDMFGTQGQSYGTIAPKPTTTKEASASELKGMSITMKKDVLSQRGFTATEIDAILGDMSGNQ